ncbi:MAG TPA: cytochrome c oxidase assembly protein [Hyphomonadaceae bacterium]|nr:cytochrome c oxidase assembly protein [Hyphomonadaceae bacterium]
MTPRARLTMFILSGAAIGMLGLSFAAEPLYSTFCRVTGFGGTTQVATKPSREVLDRKVRVRFDANVGDEAPLEFKPGQPYMDIKVGETVMAFYEVTNTADYPVRVMASYNVAPAKVGVYFQKIECFCFKERTLAPGKTEKLPVIFYVSADMDRDRLADDVNGITLSYTYYFAGNVGTSARLEDASAVN